MDHDGSIASAKSIVEVSLFDPTWSRENRLLALAWPLLENERRKWVSREQEYQHRVSCRNPLFGFSPTLVDLDATDEIKLLVWPRSWEGG